MFCAKMMAGNHVNLSIVTGGIVIQLLMVPRVLPLVIYSSNQYTTTEEIS